MKQLILIFSAIFFVFSTFAAAQDNIPTATLVSIVRAEDERRFDKTLENLLSDRSEKVRLRAALAAGRIGDERAIPALAALLEKDTEAVRAMAAFALGEIESAKGADAVLRVLRNEKTPAEVRARAVEAAGKIAAVISQSDREKAEELGDAILDTVEFEARQAKPDRKVILLGLTAILRARPEDGDYVAGIFLTNLDARIRADVANTLARLRSKNFNENLRAMLLTDDDAIARANAARALGAAEDKDSLNALLEAAVSDDDVRVRVSAIRAVGSLKDKTAAGKLLEYGEKLLGDYKKSKAANPSEKNELLEIAAALGRLLPNTNDERALKFLNDFRDADGYISPETEIAFARIAPEKYIAEFNSKNKGFTDWRVVAAYSQAFAEIGNFGDDKMKARAGQIFADYVGGMQTAVKPDYQKEMSKAMPEFVRATAALKPDNLGEILRSMLTNSDVFVRTAAAESMGDLPSNKENIEALKKAFNKAILTDKTYNDAQLAILDALYKLDKNEAVPTLILALNSKDYLVRKKASELLRDKDLQSDLVKISLEKFEAQKKNRLFPDNSGSKLGVILNKDADYTRAVSRKNGSVKAVLTTEKGTFTIDLLPEDAPLTVDNFIKLARAGYFNNVAVHRVVPNFVIQDGDPRGDGNGGPGWQIRCEINLLEYDRGAVGMALSGKDTGGSQWFVTHSPQPHLDGGYTVFGKVSEADMKVVDSIVRGDKILNVQIVETNSRTNSETTKKK
jgi:Peptidyl-prolyl cis-trans isomerase (rotamase) - cyclophilin family